MVNTPKALLLVVLAVLAYPNDIFGGAYQPEFSGPIKNLTIPLGRDATFTCLVKHLGGYRVGWVKADTKAIQAIHEQVITHNKRISVSHSDHTTWNLNIKGVQVEDEGLYMCQINTDPMKSQTGMLSIVVPPDFVSEDTSSDVNVGEGGQVKLTCRARGVPPPRVLWRREDSKGIIIREPAGSALNQKSHVSEVIHGEELKLTKISRTEMGIYLCIASNGVPPTISKRISINVHFPPSIHVPNQLVGAPLGTDVVLECYVEASPMSINYWVKEGTMLITSTQHVVEMSEKSPFEVRMTLLIKNLQKENVGTYHCAAKNSLGEVDSTIRLYEIPGPAKTELATWSSIYDDDNNNRIPYGQGEMDKTENNSAHMEISLLHGSNHHARLPPTLATELPTSVKIGKNRPTVNVSSYATDFTIKHNTLLLLLSLLSLLLLSSSSSFLLSSPTPPSPIPSLLSSSSSSSFTITVTRWSQ
ncbi:PREDICTED: lachesin-like isoform X2 [Polistes dominula]|nr:PREDICTED: lachesin-like isoform X2 [Polistes dominula]XP_015181635.1 PREDICTED: lachesin-like isoform X2 [Polistes dominula]XP_015181636.1 PREDICTED: lachesin-like isoform X2 [Polistes dominula]